MKIMREYSQIWFNIMLIELPDVPKSTAEEATNTNTNTNTKPGKTEQDSAEPRILIRATDGTTKFSTHVSKSYNYFLDDHL